MVAFKMAEIPELMRRHDLLAQPSDEENFGLSVAERKHAGCRSSSELRMENSEYLSSRNIRLADDHPETFAAALAEMSRRKGASQHAETKESRRVAEESFHVDAVVDRLIAILRYVAFETRY
jgi:glycosyltransferase involved in cell wall biosynthesis